jgi:hypothetical protein
METQSLVPTPKLAVALRNACLERVEDAQNLMASDVLSLPDVTAGDFAQIAVALDDVGGVFTAARATLSLPLKAPLELVGLSNRSRNAVQCQGISNLGELLAWAPRALLELPNFGVESLANVYAALDVLGLRPGVPATAPDSDTEMPDQSFCAAEKRAIAAALDDIARVLVHVHPGATVADVLELVTDEVRLRPATDLLFYSPDTSSLRARIEVWRADLNDKERLILERRSSFGPRPALEVIGQELGMTRERVRQLEQRMGVTLAADPLVAAKINQLQALSPLCSTDQFRSAGFDFDEPTAYLFLAARHSDVFSSRAEIGPVDVAGQQLVLIGSGSVAEGLERNIRTLMTNHTELRHGALETLPTALSAELAAPGNALAALEPSCRNDLVDRLLADAELWLDGNGGYVWYGHGRAAAVEARVLHEGAAIPMRDLEAFYDECFPNEAPALAAASNRRVTSLIHINPDLIRFADDSVSHTELGAEPPLGLKHRMLKALESAGGAMSLNQLIRELVLEDPTTRAASVNTYASGILFEMKEGIVRRRSSPLAGNPQRCGSMYKVVVGDYAGHWSWQELCSHDSMYHSSMNIPSALVGLLELDLTDGVCIRFPTGTADGGVSASSVYLHSRGGIRQVLAAAGVEDGDRFRFIVTGPGTAVCERMEPIDSSSPLSLIASTLGLGTGADALDLVPEALGLEPYTYTDHSLIEMVRCRAPGFANSYFAINPIRVDD